MVDINEIDRKHGTKCERNGQHVLIALRGAHEQVNIQKDDGKNYF